jgi:hypothetical protein
VRFCTDLTRTHLIWCFPDLEPHCLSSHTFAAPGTWLSYITLNLMPLLLLCRFYYHCYPISEYISVQILHHQRIFYWVITRYGTFPLNLWDRRKKKDKVWKRRYLQADDFSFASQKVKDPLLLSLSASSSLGRILNTCESIRPTVLFVIHYEFFHLLL